MANPGLPRSPFTIQGGCNCKAIRYRVNVPAFQDRPENPYRTPGADIGDLRVPMSVICMCNDCRRATSQVIAMALVADVKTVETSALLDDSNVPRAGPVVQDEEARQYVPASDVFDAKNLKLGETFLGCYKSSPQRSRFFCRRCGTPIGYAVDAGVIPKEWNWPTMLDIWLGTVDRSDLEKPWMHPERTLWCAYGIGWVLDLVGSSGIPSHPLTKIDKLMDSKADESGPKHPLAEAE